jgi:hypothetical protein
MRKNKSGRFTIKENQREIILVSIQAFHAKFPDLFEMMGSTNKELSLRAFEKALKFNYGEISNHKLLKEVLKYEVVEDNKELKIIKDSNDDIGELSDKIIDKALGSDKVD